MSEDEKSDPPAEDPPAQEPEGETAEPAEEPAKKPAARKKRPSRARKKATPTGEPAPDGEPGTAGEAAREEPPAESSEPAGSGESEEPEAAGAIEVEAEPFDATQPPAKGERTVRATHRPREPEGEAPQAKGPPEGADERATQAWGMACHLSTLVTFGFSILLYGLIGPFLIWMLLKGRYPGVAQPAREAINFQLNLLFWYVVAFFLSLSCLFSWIGAPLMVALPLINIVFTIIAAVRTAEGEPYRYPLTLRVID